MQAGSGLYDLQIFLPGMGIVVSHSEYSLFLGQVHQEILVCEQLIMYF